MMICAWRLTLAARSHWLLLLLRQQLLTVGCSRGACGWWPRPAEYSLLLLLLLLIQLAMRTRRLCWRGRPVATTTTTTILMKSLSWCWWWWMERRRRLLLSPWQVDWSAVAAADRSALAQSSCILLFVSIILLLHCYCRCCCCCWINTNKTTTKNKIKNIEVFLSLSLLSSLSTVLFGCTACRRASK